MSTAAATPRFSPPAPPGETRIAVRDASWKLYELWVDSLPPRSAVRMAYDGKDLEIMTKGLMHEDYRDLLGKLVSEVCVELNIPHKSLGETTWKRPDISRGLEADQCYYFEPEKLAKVAAALARGSNDAGDYPTPDLAIEIDISPSLVDRPSIYAALGVSELWHFDGELLVMEKLGLQGHYFPVPTSQWVPVAPDDVVRWLTREDASDESAWTRRLRTWVHRRSDA